MDRNPNHPFLWKQLLDTPYRSHASDPYEQLFADWNDLTIYYASRELTVPNDKLVALSGLANNMKARLQQLRPGPHRYLAGHWEETLMDTLLWSVEEPVRRPLQYRAPSWSWACLDGDIDFSSCDDRETIPFASVVSVEMTHPGKEDTGEVDGGILTLKGPCALARLDLNPFGPSKLILQDEDGSSLDSMDEGKSVDIFLDTLDDLTEEVLLIWVCAESSRVIDFLGRAHTQPYSLGVYWYCHGLALAQVEEDKHRRLGTVMCEFDSEDDARAFSAGIAQKQIRII